MADSNIYQQIVLGISNAQAGQTIWVELQAQSASVAWSTGPAFESSGGINITVPVGGAVPVNYFSVNGSSVQVQTQSSSSAGGALQMTITLFLVAQPSISTFSLRSRSDQGVAISAKVGNAQAQAVNPTYTLFAWSPQ